MAPQYPDRDGHRRAGAGAGFDGDPRRGPSRPCPTTEGEALTFEDVARRELPVLYRVARRLEANPSDAEDLVASALMRASAAWAGFDGRHPRSFLIRILRNEFLQRRRKAGARVETVELDPEEFSDEPWPQVDWSLVRPCLDRALARLPDEAKLCVVLCDVEEMSYEEAAAVLDIPVGTVKSRLFRARRTLRNRLAVHFRDLL